MIKELLEKKSFFLLAGGAVLVALVGIALIARSNRISSLATACTRPVTKTDPGVPARVAETPVEEIAPSKSEKAPRSAGELIEKLEAMKGINPPGTKQYREMVASLALFLEENPDSWSELCALVTGDYGMFAKWRVIEALAQQSDSARAHGILVSFLEDPALSSKLKPTILSVLSHADDIPDATVAVLWEIASRKGPLRTLSMEVLARCIEKCPTSAGEIVRFLDTSLRTLLNEGDSKGVVGALHALGLTGADSETGVVRYLTGHECPRIRGAAFKSLAMLDPEGASASLRHALRNDAEPSVRIQVLSALKGSPFSGVEEGLLPDILWVAQHDEHEIVRLETLRFFHQSYEELPVAVRDTFGRLAEVDASEDVRNWARWYLTHGFHS